MVERKGSHSHDSLDAAEVMLEQGYKDVQQLSTRERRNRLSYAIQASIDAVGLRANELAPRLQVSPNTVARWARGETIPNALNIGNICAELGIYPELLIFPPAVPNYPIEKYKKPKISSNSTQNVND